ncbi:hypothetical protein VTL71DRAFT_15421 [Oculimacula yallundae]|uniref:Uncharacterized protein n=1 Tax=Oculimacula yallundae TaxID=86028 RepID=A0ABR4CIP8_9HELO
MLRHAFLTLFLVDVSIAVGQTCIWKDGTTAKDYSPCVNSTQTSGTCCFTGEACLETGLCYSQLGIIYRGACINQWGGGGCPTYCDSISDKWANIYPCAFKGSGSTFGPESWSCGAGGTDLCTASNQSFVLKLAAPGNVKRIAGSPEASNSATLSSSGTATSSSNTSANTSPGAAQEPSIDQKLAFAKNGTAIGLGVALGVVALLWAATAFWLFRTNHRQKATIALLTGSTTLEVKDEPRWRGGHQQSHTEVEGHVVGSEMDGTARKPQPAELGY